jgi:hypothetical protein
MSTAIISEIPFLKSAIPHCVRRLINEFPQNNYGLTYWFTLPNYHDPYYSN